MGSKRKIMDFVVQTINENYNGGVVCDLFAGSCIVAGALSKLVPVHSNDIQYYSTILAKTYLTSLDKEIYKIDIVNKIISETEIDINSFKKKYKQFNFVYNENMTIEEFIKIEDSEKELINLSFPNDDFHLFTKYYSGTYWSYEQCLWIDKLVRKNRDYLNTPIYNIVLASIMHAMSYTSQSTGHFAQYRTVKDETSMKDILSYRLKEFKMFFKFKFEQLYNFLGKQNHIHKITNLDFIDCLNQIEENTLVYADPPYANVHYSRFYHAFETLAKYDYPTVEFKGRYRSDRHQSPFSKKSETMKAFEILFSKIKEKKSDIILSYSKSGVITLEDILIIAEITLGINYQISYKGIDYKHSTMGRKFDKNIDVTELLIVAKRIS